MWSEVVWSEMEWNEGKGSDVKRREVMWSEVKWSEVKWREVMLSEWKGREVMWREGKWCEVVWSEMVWTEVMWSEGKESDDLRWNWFTVMLYVCSVQYVISLAAVICYCAITRLRFFICFLFCVFCDFVLFLYRFVYYFSFVLLPILLQIYRPLPPGGTQLQWLNIISICHWEKMSPNKMTIIQFHSLNHLQTAVNPRCRLAL
jgi:hypothetical protein